MKGSTTLAQWRRLRLAARSWRVSRAPAGVRSAHCVIPPAVDRTCILAGPCEILDARTVNDKTEYYVHFAEGVSLSRPAYADATARAPANRRLDRWIPASEARDYASREEKMKYLDDPMSPLASPVRLQRLPRRARAATRAFTCAYAYARMCSQRNAYACSKTHRTAAPASMVAVVTFSAPQTGRRATRRKKFVAVSGDDHGVRCASHATSPRRAAAV